MTIFMRDYAPRFERRARMIDRLGEILATGIVVALVVFGYMVAR